jgi:hypothetical protein
VRSLSDVTSMYEQPFDQAVCWRGGSEAQAKRHIRRGETPCRACQEGEPVKLVTTPLDWAACGTEANAAAHRRRGEPPCAKCRAAETRAHMERRQAKR